MISTADGTGVIREKEKREGFFEHAAWVSEVLVILLYGVLC